MTDFDVRGEDSDSSYVSYDEDDEVSWKFVEFQIDVDVTCFCVSLSAAGSLGKGIAQAGSKRDSEGSIGAGQ